MENILHQFLQVLVNGLRDQPFVVHLLISFILLLGLTSYLVINYLLSRVSELQKEQEDFRKISKALMKQALYRNNGVIELDD